MTAVLFRVICVEGHYMKNEKLDIFVDREDVRLARGTDGSLHITSRYFRFRGKRYTSEGLANYIRNEIFRKNSKPLTRTTSERFRAGTRRTKRIARATR